MVKKLQSQKLAHSCFAIIQNPQCYLKRNAATITYRNDWCENKGDCASCSIAKRYLDGQMTLKPNPWPDMNIPAILHVDDDEGYEVLI